MLQVLYLHAVLATLSLGAAALTTGPVVRGDGSSLKVSENIVALERVNGKGSASSQALQLSRAFSRPSTQLIPAEGAFEYLINVKIGQQSFKLIFDTGSSDTWAASSSFKCVSAKLKPLPQKQCHFGPLYQGTFQHGEILNQNFNITYGDGEFLTGDMGCSDIDVAGLTVQRQEMALVDRAYWFGDDISSGLIGFAYPSLTSAYKGNDPTKDNQNTTQVQYNPWVTNAINQKLLNPPVFSLAIDRGPRATGGQLALGGLPNVTVSSKYTTVPLRIKELINVKKTASELSFYSILPDGIVLKGTQPGAKERFIPLGPASAPPGSDNSQYAIVDSGTTLIYLPTHISNAVNAAFDPPAKYVKNYDAWEADCNAKVPTFGVRIGGHTFYVDAKDLLPTYPIDKDPNTGKCLLGVQPTDSVNVLGDVFLKNVVAVFDVGNSQMKFAARAKY